MLFMFEREIEPLPKYVPLLRVFSVPVGWGVAEVGKGGSRRLVSACFKETQRSFKIALPIFLRVRGGAIAGEGDTIHGHVG